MRSNLFYPMDEDPCEHRHLMKTLRILALVLFACGGPPAAQQHPNDRVAISPAIQARDAPDRDADDRALDAGRHPAEMLDFFGIGPGMTVADLAAGRGYTTELLARTVGETGKVYAENNKLLLGFGGDDWSKRLQKPVMKNVIRVDRELDDPLPPEAKNLDAVVMVLFYHDTVWQKTDQAKMNAAIFAALKPGGVYGIVDHSAAAGAGRTQTQTFHRIEQSEVVKDVTAAGFKLAGEASFLRNPADTRDWNDSPREAGPRRGTSDRFVLKFVKP